MAKITYHTHDNKTHTVDVQKGLTVMEGAVQNDIPGIDADCGGRNGVCYMPRLCQRGMVR